MMAETRIQDQGRIRVASGLSPDIGIRINWFGGAGETVRAAVLGCPVNRGSPSKQEEVAAAKRASVGQ